MDDSSIYALLTSLVGDVMLSRDNMDAAKERDPGVKAAAEEAQRAISRLVAELDRADGIDPDVRHVALCTVRGMVESLVHLPPVIRHGAGLVATKRQLDASIGPTPTAKA